MPEDVNLYVAIPVVLVFTLMAYLEIRDRKRLK